MPKPRPTHYSAWVLDAAVDRDELVARQSPDRPWSPSPSPAAPGILTAKTLQTILSLGNGDAANKSPQRFPATSSPDASTRHGEHSAGKKSIERKRKQAQVKLAPMPEAATSRGNQRNLSAPNSLLAKPAVAAAIPTTQRMQHLRDDLGQHTRHQQAISVQLGQEFQWIETHFPLIKLATSKCSLQLRQQLFRKTITTHFYRGQQRLAWQQWTRYVMDAKRTALLRLGASQRIVELFSDACLDVLAVRFTQWQGVVVQEQEDEQEAAAITIQLAYRRRQARARLHEAQELSLAEALDRVMTHAATIQRAFRAHTRLMELRRTLAATKSVQRAMRVAVARRRRRQEHQQQHHAAKTIQNIRRQHLRYQQEHAVFLNSQARKIQLAWREHVQHRVDTVSDCLAIIVHHIELTNASQAIQSRARGFLCRLHAAKEQAAVGRMQRVWRRHHRRVVARHEQLQMRWRYALAACAIQQMCQRYRQRIKLQFALKKSSKPLFLRARAMNDSFRVQYHTPIVYSAASTIQHSWRKHVAYCVRQKQLRAAATVLQCMWRRYQTQHHWQWLRDALMRRKQHHQRLIACKRLQRWWRGRFDAVKAASLAHQLAQLLAAALTIQRYFRRRRNHWDGFLRDLLVHLTDYKRAARVMARVWKRYHQRQLVRLREKQLADMALLHEMLLEQRRQEARRQAAAQCIQRAWRRRQAWVEGKVLRRRYKILRKQEMEQQQRRKVIRQFLMDKEAVRATKRSQNSITPSRRSGDRKLSHGDAAHGLTPAATAVPSEPAQSSDKDDAGQWQKHWSEEHQAHYLVHVVTGESRWAT